MDEEETTDVEPAYVNVLQDHIEHLALHIAGSDEASPSEPSYYEPCGYWTADEKDAFFHGLSVHSRLRPDLIAAEIKTKSVVDVSAFLSMLAEAAGLEKRRRLKRNAFEAAVEVSDTWLDFEEEQANIMMMLEPDWEAAHAYKERRTILKAKRVEYGIARRKRFFKQDTDDIQSRIEEFRSFRIDLEVEWEKEDFRSELGLTHLKVLDNVLREAEELRLDETHNKSKTTTMSRHTVEEATPVPLSEPTPQTISDDMIDPDLLAISNPSAHSMLLQNANIGNVDKGEAALDALSATTESLSIAPVEQPLISSEVASLDKKQDGHDDLSRLSPRSRRRYQKRLYMRRKRAELNGDPDTFEQTIERLKPGRKTNKRRKPNTEGVDFSRTASPEIEDVTTPGPDRLSSASRGSETLIESNVETTTPQKLPNIGGMTLPYKIKAQFTRLGLDAMWLKENGLGLFHLSALGKLMNLHASLNGATDEDDICSQISADAIQMLHAHIVYFVTDLIHKAIVIREEEGNIKEHTKVWRLNGGHIVGSTVHEALEIMGAERNKQRFFERYSSAMTPAEESDSEAPAKKRRRIKSQVAVDSSEDDSPETNEHKEAFSSVLSMPVRRQLNLPFVKHPCLDTESLNHNRGQSSTFLIRDPSDNSELIPINTDKEALLAELIEEEELDTLDRQHDAKEMGNLWSSFARDKHGRPIFDDDIEDGSSGGEDEDDRIVNFEENVDRKYRIRHDESLHLVAPPNTANGIKSMIYVPDSD